MTKYFISDGISGESMKQMLRCFSPQFKTYSPEEVIMRYSGSPRRIGLVRSGRARLESLDADGNVNLLETFEEQELFGELFCLPLDNFEYLVSAERKCRIIFIEYSHIITPCSNACPHHSQLINNLFLMAAERSQALSLHLGILSQPTIRKRLLAYLRHMKEVAGTNPFALPMSRSEMAHYLRMDRSAMTRELRHMEADGLVQINKREIFLCR